MKPALQKVIENIIKQKASELDSFLYQVKVEAEHAQQAAINDPENAPNIYNRYASAIQKKILEGKQKKEQVQAKAADVQFNMAVTAHDSIFPNIHLPGGISTKATEYKDLASKGDKWESPVFSIGSAGKSSNIPSVGEITRKEHNVNNGGVGGTTNGNQQVGNTNGFSQQVDQAFGKETSARPTNGNTSAGPN